MQAVTKANKLPVNDYTMLLNVAAKLRKVYLGQVKPKYQPRVYTEARIGGLRSKMCINHDGFDDGGLAVMNVVNKKYNHLGIKIYAECSTNSGYGPCSHVSIFVKFK